jgi:hydantoinase/carbamoylase family amidase
VLIDRDRVRRRLEALWQLARGPGGGADRPAFSAAEAEAMLLVAAWARDTGLVPSVDRHGNLWALPEGWDGRRPLVSAGSHVDTVPDGGRYDGALGTVLALELAALLYDGTSGGAAPALLVCAAEEAPRFGAGTIGSRLLVGSMDAAALAQMRDRVGVDAASAQTSFRADLAAGGLHVIEPPLERLRAHAEVHIATRRSVRELGVVEHVASPLRLAIELSGEAGHAGEIAMEERRDALAAAAELVLAVEAAARAEPPETVATVGTLDVEPGAVSVIPARVRLGLDLRAVSEQSLGHLEAAVRSAAAEVAARRGIDASVRLLRAGTPTRLDPGPARAALAAASRLGIAAAATWSGAGHDAQHLASLMPTLLLFVPLSGGESHTPLEDADPRDIENAARIAREVLDTAR